MDFEMRATVSAEPALLYDRRFPAIDATTLRAALAHNVVRRRDAGDDSSAQLTTCFNSPLAYFSAIFDRLIALILLPWPAQLNSW